MKAPKSFWLWAIFGTIAACVAGAIYAWYLKESGDWSTGLPWETALLMRIHRPMPAIIDWTLLMVPWIGTNLTILPGVAIAWWQLRKRHRPDLIAAVVVAAAGNYILGFFLKFAFDRPRPHLWEQRGEFTGSSYPSGHAATTISLLFFYSHLIHMERGWRWPYFVSFVFMLLTAYSRLYLGVHWPTDLIGGAVIGVVWLTAMLRAVDGVSDFEHVVPWLEGADRQSESEV